jgi:hypothetical protein
MEADNEHGFDELAMAVGRESDALAHLRFKFEVQQLMLAGGQGIWLNETTHELEAAIAAVQGADAGFRAALQRSAISLGLSPESTLREVAEVVGEPWHYIFEQGREDLRCAVERIGLLCDENRKLLARGYSVVSEALTLLGAAPAGSVYDATGAPARGATRAAILNTKA